MRKSLALFAVLLSLSLSACGHYRVTDTATGDVYVTNDWWKVRKSQKPETTITFKEKLSGEVVTLEGPEAEKIKCREYRAEVKDIKAAAAM